MNTYLYYIMLYYKQQLEPDICTWLLKKNIALTIQTFVNKVMSLLFNTLTRFVIVFLPRSKHLLISWLQSPSATKKIKSVTVSTVSTSISHEVIRPATMILIFWMLSLNQLFHSPLSPSSKGSLVFFAFCHKGGVICISVVIDPGNLDFSLCFFQPSVSHDVLCI